MSANYSQMEMALMDLDRAVSHLARQADGIKNKMSAQKGQTNDLFALLGSAGGSAIINHPAGELDLGVIERRLDATIAQIEDLLSEDAMAGAQ